VGQDCILLAGFQPAFLQLSRLKSPCRRDLEPAFQPATTAFEPAFAFDQR